MDDIYENIKEYNIDKKHKVLIAFDMIADMLSNKRLNPIVTELFITSRKLSIFLLFMIQSCFVVPKKVRLNYTHYCIMAIPKKSNIYKLHLIIYQMMTIKTL